jgi:hypothetical protein
MSELNVVLGGTNSWWTIPFTSKKKMRMLFIELRTCRTSLLLAVVGSSTVTIVPLFVDHNCKSNLCHPLWVKVGSSLAFSRNSRHTFTHRCIHFSCWTSWELLRTELELSSYWLVLNWLENCQRTTYIAFTPTKQKTSPLLLKCVYWVIA